MIEDLPSDEEVIEPEIEPNVEFDEEEEEPVQKNRAIREHAKDKQIKDSKTDVMAMARNMEKMREAEVNDNDPRRKNFDRTI
jgi:hypothetical protein